MQLSFALFNLICWQRLSHHRVQLVSKKDRDKQDSKVNILLQYQAVSHCNFLISNRSLYISPDQEKHIIRHFGKNDFFQKNRCLLH